MHRTNEFYGLAEPLPTDERCSVEKLKLKKEEFIQTITLSKYQRDTLEFDTRQQSSSSRWFMERRNRLTASDFGKICKMRPATSCKNTVFSKFSSTFSSTNEPIACKYGKDMEPIALEYFEKNMGTQIQKCGLLIDEKYPFSGASPDGLIRNDSIIEVKCPHSAKYYPTIEEAIKDKKINFLQINQNGEINLKHDDNYYYQIIGQLRISKRNICHFIVYSHNWKHIEIIKYYPQFWFDKMESKLIRFYYECILPEIVDPQYGKRFLISDIIDPNYIITAQKSKIKK